MRLAAAVVVAGIASCAEPVKPRPLAPEASVAGPRRSAPRYFVSSPAIVPTIVEEDGAVTRAVASGRRLELRGPAIAQVGSDEPYLDAGRLLPAWLRAAGAPPYLFWSRRELFAADAFFGSPRLVAPLGREVREAFDWLSGVGLSFAGGARVMAPEKGLGARFGAGFAVGCVVRGVAADARFGVLQTALGHAWVTTDAGHHFTDATATFGGSTDLEVRSGVIVGRLSEGRERAMGPDGQPAPPPPPTRRLLGPLSEDPFYAATEEDPLDAATRAGVPLDDGAILIAARGHGRGYVARFDPDKMRTTSLVALPSDLADTSCEPVRAGADLLLACVSAEHATLLDVSGAPRPERSFDLAGASELDRFIAGGDDALGYLGSCDGSPVHVAEVEVGAGGDPGNASPQRSPVFCVRKSADEWVEHRVPPAEAADLIAWIPRRGGDAIALLARPGASPERPRVSLRGGLRVVSARLGQPPLYLSTGLSHSEVVARSIQVTADDVIEGWLTMPDNTASAFTIDGRAVAHAFAPPRLSSVAHAGLLALGATEDGHLFETRDGGQRWTEVAPPPLGRGAPLDVTRCSPAGCSVGSFNRLGWGADPMPRPTAPEAPLARSPRTSARAALPPLIELACAASAPPEGARREAAGLAFGPEGHAHVDGRALDDLGVAEIPEAIAANSSADLAWIEPLVPSAPIVRRSVLLGSLPPPPESGWDLTLGRLLTARGAVDLFAVGRSCAAPLFDAVGLGRSLGACAPEGSIGVEVSGRVLVLHVADAALDLWSASVADASRSPGASRGVAPAARARRAGPPKLFAGQRPLHPILTTPIGGPTEGFAFGIGDRAGLPVIVATDALGDASLAPIDLETGGIGREEPLASLRNAQLGSAASCARTPSDARVLLPLAGAIGIDASKLPGVRLATGKGLLLARWSARRLCIDALELPIVDLRFEGAAYGSEPSVAVRKLVARFEGSPDAAIVLAAPGEETRQRIICSTLEGAPP